MNQWLVLLGFIVVCYGVSLLASMVTIPEVRSWYPGIRKPAWTPPDWLFGPVWTLLYGMMAVSGWLVWRAAGFSGARSALAMFIIQLLLNGAWSFIFFKFHRIEAALADISLLLLAIIGTILLFSRISVAAAWLLVPYLLWVGYATALNARIWMLNR